MQRLLYLGWCRPQDDLLPVQRGQVRSSNGRQMVPLHWRGRNRNADQVRVNQPLRYTRPWLAGRKSPEQWRGSRFTEDLFPLERRLLQMEQADQGAELRRVLRVRVGADSSLQPALLWTRPRTNRFVFPASDRQITILQKLLFPPSWCLRLIRNFPHSLRMTCPRRWENLILEKWQIGRYFPRKENRKRKSLLFQSLCFASSWYPFGLLYFPGADSYILEKLMTNRALLFERRKSELLDCAFETEPMASSQYFFTFFIPQNQHLNPLPQSDRHQNASLTQFLPTKTARRPSPSPTWLNVIVQWPTNGTDSLARQESKCRPRACQSTTAVHMPRAGWTEITRAMTRESFHGRFVSTGAATAAGGASRSGCGTAAISSCTSWGRLQSAACATVERLHRNQ